MKVLAWPRLLFTALALLFLFGILVAARGEPPLTKAQARARAALALAGAKPAAPYGPKYPTVCPCSGRANCTCEPGRCICGPCLTQPVDPFNDPNRPWSKKATDGGPDYQWDCHRGQWWRPGPNLSGPFGYSGGLVRSTGINFQIDPAFGHAVRGANYGYCQPVGGFGGGACRVGGS